MAFTYNANPGTGDASQKRDAVRLYIGDTDSTDALLQDAEVDFYIAEAADNLYLAAALASRAIAAKFSRLVDSQVEGISTRFSQQQKQYQELAFRMERSARQNSAVGIPVVGGISKDAIESAEEDDDRVEPAFTRRQFRNPPREEIDEDPWHR